MREHSKAAPNLILHLLTIAQLVCHVDPIDADKLLRDGPFIEVALPVAALVGEVDAARDACLGESGQRLGCKAQRRLEFRQSE